MKEFILDEAYFTDVIERKEWNMYTANGRVPTDEELLLILQGKGNMSITGSKDHPEFAKLRTQLDMEGYIRIEPGWINGDRVLKPFMLNGYKFKEGEQFSSAAAMGIHFKVRKKYPDEFDND